MSWGIVLDMGGSFWMITVPQLNPTVTPMFTPAIKSQAETLCQDKQIDGLLCPSIIYCLLIELTLQSFALINYS